MFRFAPIRFAATAGIALATSLSAQSPKSPQTQPSVAGQAASTLPATPPTTTPEIPQVPLTPQQRPAQRAQIIYADGTLSVSADNSSLNQILRQISSDTGIKITGGVADERVFGKYGPADPAQILAALINGTGSNMILVHREGEAHAELILTPRQGGPTPPSPNSHAFDERREAPEPPPSRAEQLTPPASVPVVNSPANTAAPPTSPANPSQPESPNGVKTPQQIYEQLQRMRQQQQQPTQPQ